MNYEELTYIILDKLEWFYEDTARKKHGSFKGCTKGELIYTILEYGSGPEVAKALGCGSQTFNRMIKELLVPIFGHLNGGGESWKNVLINYSGYKYCPSCKNYLEHTNYYRDNSRSYGLDKVCKTCKVSLNAKNYKKYNKWIKEYIFLNYKYYIARNAKRRASKLQATPKWADLEAIKEIYKSCPEGYHVDHIIPLQGELVCGLHVHKNLKPISAAENLAKGNKFEI